MSVLRAGYGIYYDTVSARSQYAQNTIEGPTWPWTTGIGNQTANTATNGFGIEQKSGGTFTQLGNVTTAPVYVEGTWDQRGGGLALHSRRGRRFRSGFHGRSSNG